MRKSIKKRVAACALLLSLSCMALPAQWQTSPNKEYPFRVLRVTPMKDLLPQVVDGSSLVRTMMFTVNEESGTSLMVLEDHRLIEFDIENWQYKRTIVDNIYTDSTFRRVLRVDDAIKSTTYKPQIMPFELSGDEIIFRGPALQGEGINANVIIARWHKDSGFVWSKEYDGNMFTLSPDKKRAMVFSLENRMQMIEIDMQTGEKIHNLTLFAGWDQREQTITDYGSDSKHKIGLWFNTVTLLDERCKPIKKIFAHGGEVDVEKNYIALDHSPDMRYIIIYGANLPSIVIRGDSYNPISSTPFIFWRPGEPYTNSYYPVRFLGDRPSTVIAAAGNDMFRRIIIDDIETEQRDTVSATIESDYSTAYTLWGVMAGSHCRIYRNKILSLGFEAVMIEEGLDIKTGVSEDTPKPLVTARFSDGTIVVHRSAMDQEWQVSLYDNQGRRVVPPQALRIGQSELVLNPGTLPGGMYFVQSVTPSTVVSTPTLIIR